MAKAAPSKSQNVYFIAGGNELLVKEKAKSIAHSLAANLGPFGLEIIDGGVDSVEKAEGLFRNLTEALETLPFMGGGKVVWLKDCSIFGDSQTSKTIIVREGLANLQDRLKAGIPPEVTLIISATEVDKRKSFYKAIDKVAEVHLFEAPDLTNQAGKEALFDFIQERALKDGFKIHEQAAVRLADLVGGDFLILQNELEKLFLYVSPRKEITVADIRAISSSTRDHIVWGLGDAVADRNLGEAFKVLEQLLFQGENAVGLMSMLISKMRTLLLVRELMDQKILTSGRGEHSFKSAFQAIPESVRAKLPSDKKFNPLAGNQYAIYLATEKASNYSKEELVRS